MVKYKVLARVPLCVQLVEVFEVTPNNIMIAQARQHRATNEQSLFFNLKDLFAIF